MFSYERFRRKSKGRRARSQSEKQVFSEHYGLKKDGTPRKGPVPKSAWTKGQAGNPDTVWKPGISPNPGGRPQKTPVTDAMRDLLREPHPDQKKWPGRTRAQVQALQILAQAEKGDLASQKEMLDRTEGKVAQSVRVGGDVDNPTPIVFDQMTPEEKRLKVAALLARQSGGKDGNRKRN